MCYLQKESIIAKLKITAFTGDKNERQEHKI